MKKISVKIYLELLKEFDKKQIFATGSKTETYLELLMVFKINSLQNSAVMALSCSEIVFFISVP